MYFSRHMFNFLVNSRPLTFKLGDNLIPLLFVLSALLLSGCQSTKPNRSQAQQTLNKGSQQPNEAQTLVYKKALAFLDNKQYDKSYTLLIRLSKELPSFSGSWVNLGLIKLVQKDPQSAKRFVERAIELSPQLPQAMNLLGLIATHDRDIKQAEKYYLKALKLNDKYANAHYNLALLYEVYLQDIGNAVKHYQAYLANNDGEDATTQGWLENLQSSLSR